MSFGDACVIITLCESVVTSQYHYNHTMSYLHCRVTVTDSTRPLYSETTPVKRQKTSSAESPRHFFLHLLLKHPEGLWDGAESAENSTQWERCMEYFDFLCQLIRYLRGMCVYRSLQSHVCACSCGFPSTPEYEQDSLSVDVHQMVHAELEWLKNIHSTSNSPALQSVLAGHLYLCRALFTCEGVDKKNFGRELCVHLISKFLFPASRMIHESHEPLQGIVNINPM